MSLSKWISEKIPIWRFHFSISRTLKPSISEGICLFSKLPISLCLSPSASEEYGVISSTVIKTQIGTISGFQKYHSSWFQNTRYFDSNKYHGSFHELADRLPRFSFASRRARQGTRCRWRLIRSSYQLSQRHHLEDPHPQGAHRILDVAVTAHRSFFRATIQLLYSLEQS